MKRCWVILGAIALTGCGGPSVEPAKPTEAGQDDVEQLALFTGSDSADGPSAIFTADIKTNALVRLTDGQHRDINPIWSRDGSFVIFTRRDEGTKERTPYGNAHLWRVDCDARNLRRLTDGEVFDLATDLSAGPGRVVLSRQQFGEKFSYYSIEEEGGDLRVESDVPDSVSPDGEWQLTGRPISENEDEHLMDYWLRRSDGSLTLPLKAFRGQVRYPQWLPDSSAVLVEREADDGYTWWLIRVPSGKQTKVFDATNGHQAVALAPNGRQIVFLKRDGGTADWPIYSLHVSDLSGGAVRKLLEPNGHFNPQWTKNGRSVLLQSEVDRSILTLVNVDGSGSKAIGCGMNADYVTLRPDVTRVVSATRGRVARSQFATQEN